MAQFTGNYSDFIETQVKRLEHLQRVDPINAASYKEEIAKLRASKDATPKTKAAKEAAEEQAEIKEKVVEVKTQTSKSSAVDAILDDVPYDKDLFIQKCEKLKVSILKDKLRKKGVSSKEIKANSKSGKDKLVEYCMTILDINDL